MKRSLSLLIILFVLVCPHIRSQTNIDSLEKATAIMKDDTNKCNNYLTLAKANLLKDFSGTILFGSKAHDLAKKLGYKKGELSGWIATGVGNIYAGDSRVALLYFDSVIAATGNEPRNVYYLKAINNKGLAYEALGQFAEAVDCYYRSLKANELVRDSNMMASVLGNLGNALYRNKKDKEAEAYATQGYELYKKLGNLKGMSNTLNTIAAIRETQNDLFTAEAKYTEVAQIREKIGDRTGLVSTHINLGIIDIRQKNFSRAKEHFEKARFYNRTANGSMARFIILFSFARLYREENKFAQQKIYLDSARVVAEQNGDLESMKNVYGELSKYHEGQQNFGEALKFQKLSARMKDSIFNQENEGKINELQTRYETEKKEQQNKLLAEENKVKSAELNKQRIQNMILVLSLVGVFVFGYLLYNRNKLRNRVRAMEAAEKLQKERERISRDLHDNVGSQLSYIVSNIPSDGNKNAALTEVAKNTIQNLRETIWAIHQETIDYNEFADRVKKYVALRLDGSLLIPKINVAEAAMVFTPAQALNLYRIAQEAVNNAVKYSEGTELKVEIGKSHESGFVMRICDNGKGFDLAKVDGKSYGLKNMSYRAEEIAARLEIESGPAQGTKITVTL